VNGASLRPVLVALEAAFALLAMLAVFDQSWELTYGWLGCGLLADLALTHLATSRSATDAAEPRLFDGENEFRARGALLFLNTVFVPALALVQAGFLDGLLGVGVAGLIVLSGTYRLAFQDWAAGVSEYEGFPAAWGAVGFTLHAFDATQIAAALVIGMVLVLTLVPLAWPHPIDSPRWTGVTRAMTFVAAISAATVLLHGFPAGVQAKTTIIAVSLYAVGMALIGLYLDIRQGENTDMSGAGLPSMGFAALDSAEQNETTADTGRTGRPGAP